MALVQLLCLGLQSAPERGSCAGARIIRLGGLGIFRLAAIRFLVAVVSAGPVGGSVTAPAMASDSRRWDFASHREQARLPEVIAALTGGALICVKLDAVAARRYKFT